MKTKELTGLPLLYACARNTGCSEQEFKNLPDYDRFCIALGVVVAEGIATWKNGDEWRAACPSQDGYYDDKNGIIDMGSYEGVAGKTLFEAALRAYLVYRVGKDVPDIPAWVIGPDKP